MNIAALHNKIDNAIRLLREIEARMAHVEHAVAPAPKDSLPREGEENRPPQEVSRNKFKRFVGYASKLGLPGIFLTMLTLITAYVQLRYDVSVSQYPAINPANPFQSEFVLSNDGPFSIYNVYYLCYFERLVGDDGLPINDYAVAVPYANQVLHSHGQYGISCAGEQAFHPAVRDGAVLEIRVWYKTIIPYPEHHGGAMFLLKHNESSQVVWQPVGDVPDKRGQLTHEFCVSCK